MNELQATPSVSQLGIKPKEVVAPVTSDKAEPVQAEAAPKAQEKVASSEEVQEDLAKAVSRLNDYVQSSQRDLQFSMDEESGHTVIKVVDRYTSEVIRQLPDQVVLDLAKKLNEEEPLELFSAHA